MNPERYNRGSFDPCLLKKQIEESKKKYEEQALAEANLTEEERAEKVLAAERALLREYIGLPRNPGDAAPNPSRNAAGFFIERAAGDACCRLPTCREIIPQGDYRLALAPAMNLSHWTRGRLGSVGKYDNQYWRLVHKLPHTSTNTDDG